MTFVQVDLTSLVKLIVKFHLCSNASVRPRFIVYGAFKYTSSILLLQLLRVEFLLKTDSGYSKDTGVTLFTLATPGNPLRCNTHRSAPPVSALSNSRGPRKRSQSPVDMLERRDTYGQAQVCSKGHQGSSVDRLCQPSFHRIKFWHVRNPLPQSIRLRLSVLVRYCTGQGE